MKRGWWKRDLRYVFFGPFWSKDLGLPVIGLVIVTLTRSETYLLYSSSSRMQCQCTIIIILYYYKINFFFLKIGPRRIHTVRVRGGNKKYRALRLDGGNFSWGSECKSIKNAEFTLIPPSVPFCAYLSMRITLSSSATECKWWYQRLWERCFSMHEIGFNFKRVVKYCLAGGRGFVLLMALCLQAAHARPGSLMWSTMPPTTSWSEPRPWWRTASSSSTAFHTGSGMRLTMPLLWDARRGPSWYVWRIQMSCQPVNYITERHLSSVGQQ